MNQFLGLVRKDWYWMRTEVYVVLGFYTAILIFLPLLLQKTVAKGYAFHEVIVFLSGLALFLGMFLPAIVLIWLLHHDMKHPDLWLHTTAGSTKLFSVKILLSGLVGAGLLMITGVVVTASYFPANADYSLSNLLTVESSILILLLLFVFSSTVTTLFFWVLFQVMRPRIGKFSLPLTLLLFVLYCYVDMKLSTTEFFKNYISVGEINFGAFKQKTGMFSVEGEAMFYVGDFVFGLIITVALFTFAIILFNRKVRC